MRARLQAFSLLEVVIALAIAIFALLPIVVLLPLGLNDNRMTVEQAQAIGILTAVEADLRNSHPMADSGRSLVFKLPLPYAQNGGVIGLSSSIGANVIYTIGLTESQQLVPVTAMPRPAYQASVIYTRFPANGSKQPLEARIIVNWPSINSRNSSDLTDLTKISGYIDGYVTFRLP